MSHIVIEVTVDDSEAQRELDRIMRGPDHATHLKFDGRLAEGFLVSQQAIHRITGSLAATGDTDSAARVGGGWVGQVKYGGYNVGPKGNVPLMPGPWRAKRPPSFYAYYEWRRGELSEGESQSGSHSWTDDSHGMKEAFDRISDDIADWMDGTV